VSSERGVGEDQITPPSQSGVQDGLFSWSTSTLSSLLDTAGHDIFAKFRTVQKFLFERFGWIDYPDNRQQSLELASLARHLGRWRSKPFYADLLGYKAWLEAQPDQRARCGTMTGYMTAVVALLDDVRCDSIDALADRIRAQRIIPKRHRYSNLSTFKRYLKEIFEVDLVLANRKAQHPRISRGRYLERDVCSLIQLLSTTTSPTHKRCLLVKLLHHLFDIPFDKILQSQHKDFQKNSDGLLWAIDGAELRVISPVFDVFAKLISGCEGYVFLNDTTGRVLTRKLVRSYVDRIFVSTKVRVNRSRLSASV
jgi:hypothetical protein